MKFIRNNFGLSMVEITMAMGMLGGLAVAGMKLMQNQSEAQKTIEKKYETVTIVGSIRALLSEPDNCTEVFRGQDPATFAPTKLLKRTDSGYEPVYEVGKDQPGNLKIESYKLTKSFPGLASNESMLKISFDLGKAGLRDKSDNIIKISYTVDPDTMMIFSCHALNQNTDSLWEKSMSDAHNIYYNGGLVGIGTTTPATSLDVNGGVKIGDPGSTTCTNSNAGELRYDATAKLMKFCNGSIWTLVNGPVQTYTGTIPCGNLTGIAIGEVHCPSGTTPRSCGIILETKSSAPDGLTCSLDPAMGVCKGYRDQAGVCDDGILHCYCQ